MTITDDPDITQPAVLDMRRLWVGGVATAVVAALIVLVGVVIARGILGISVLAPASAGDLGTSASAVIQVKKASGRGAPSSSRFRTPVAPSAQAAANTA